MTKRPFAYVCSPYQGDTAHNTEKAREYCRQVFDAGYTPIASNLLFPQFLDERIPEERKSGIYMANELLRRCHVLIVCGDTITESMMCEILLALRLRITTTTLDGVLAIHAYSRQPHTLEPAPHKDGHARFSTTANETKS